MTIQKKKEMANNELKWNPPCISIEEYFSTSNLSMNCTSPCHPNNEKSNAMIQHVSSDEVDCCTTKESDKIDDCDENENENNDNDKSPITNREFDNQSEYQPSTFPINLAPVHKSMKSFKLMLIMSEHFGLSVDEMITILDAAASSNKLVKNLKEFLEIKMPPGFPVQLELPLFHVLKATVTFQNFKEMDISDDLFDIPQDYQVVEKHDLSNFGESN